jgi:hypothetical protein
MTWLLRGFRHADHRYGTCGCVKGGLDPPSVATPVDKRGSTQPGVAPEGAPNEQALAPAPPHRARG